MAENEKQSLEVKVGILTNKVDDIAKKIDKLDDKISDQYVTKFEHNSLNERVKGAESNMTWAVRAIGGSIIAALVSAVYWVAGQSQIIK